MWEFMKGVPDTGTKRPPSEEEKKTADKAYQAEKNDRELTSKRRSRVALAAIQCDCLSDVSQLFKCIIICWYYIMVLCVVLIYVINNGIKILILKRLKTCIMCTGLSADNLFPYFWSGWWPVLCVPDHQLRICSPNFEKVDDPYYVNRIISW